MHSTPLMTTSDVREEGPPALRRMTVLRQRVQTLTFHQTSSAQTIMRVGSNSNKDYLLLITVVCVGLTNTCGHDGFDKDVGLNRKKTFHYQPSVPQPFCGRW